MKGGKFKVTYVSYFVTSELDIASCSPGVPLVLGRGDVSVISNVFVTENVSGRIYANLFPGSREGETETENIVPSKRI